VDWPSLDEVQRTEKIFLADGKLYVHGIPIWLRSHVLEFFYTQSWHCRVTIDSCGAQGLVCGWQRMVHEPNYDAIPYGSYGSHVMHGYPAACPPLGVATNPAYSAYGSEGGLMEQETHEPVSRAFVNLVGMNEYGAIRLICLSKIQRLSLSLHAFELEKAGVTFHFQTRKAFHEIVYVRDGAEK
jgi:hypothetical protein